MAGRALRVSDVKQLELLFLDDEEYLTAKRAYGDA